MLDRVNIVGVHIIVYPLYHQKPVKPFHMTANVLQNSITRLIIWTEAWHSELPDPSPRHDGN